MGIMMLQVGLLEGNALRLAQLFMVLITNLYIHSPWNILAQKVQTQMLSIVLREVGMAVLTTKHLMTIFVIKCI